MKEEPLAEMLEKMRLNCHENVVRMMSHPESWKIYQFTKIMETYGLLINYLGISESQANRKN